MSIPSEITIDGRCPECKSRLTWIQCVRLFDSDTVELTMRCIACLMMYDVRITLDDFSDPRNGKDTLSQ